VYYLDGQFEQAAKMLTTARNRMPDDADCGLFLGQTYIAMGRYEESSAILLDVVKKHPRYTRAYFTLGQSLGKEGNLADAHYYLAIYHIRKLDLKTAVAQYRRALKYTTDADRRAEIEERLEKYEKILAKQNRRGP
jgi:predicted Zn-dependent protease